MSPGPSHYGEIVREAAEVRAQKWVVAGLKRMRWSESDLAERRKRDAGKVRLARELRAQTTMPLEWIAKRLQMGSRGDVACLLCRQNKPDDNITK